MTVCIRGFAGYQYITEFYGDRTAKRSKVPLINHINEGIKILQMRNPDINLAVLEAFAIHPLCQGDEELRSFNPLRVELSRAVFFAMEYRNIANRYLANCDTSNIILSPLAEVNEMLVADKVQNKKDFMLYHYGTHHNSERLLEYFDQWLDALQISSLEYNRLIQGL